MNIRYTFYVGLGIILVALASVGAYKLTEQRVASTQLVLPVAPAVQSPVAEPPVVSPSSTEPVDQVFENEYMKVTVPVGWKLEELTQTLQDQKYNKDTSTTTKVGEPVTTKTGAVRLTKDSYILYIHPQAGQASGVTGGRFGEITQEAPSVNAVITEWPSSPCGKEAVTQLANGWQRNDIFLTSADKKDWCNVPAAGKTVWYFSYFTTPKGGYINYYGSQDGPTGWVITMAYNTADVNTLPQKGTPELTTALTDMTGIVKTLELKQLVK